MCLQNNLQSLNQKINEHFIWRYQNNTSYFFLITKSSHLFDDKKKSQFEIRSLLCLRQKFTEYFVIDTNLNLNSNSRGLWPHYGTALSLSLYHQVKRPYFIESIALTDSKRRYYRKSEEPFDPIYNFNLQFGKQSIFSHHDDASSLSMQLCISVSKRNLGLAN